ncbi:hypothetical protein GGR54DRAFT_651875 [Hypoxylon sp. NC1633]|nr:hypothetical protein GGR54DRAFT_651875 [Hypoxylon sp. NC1633]
MAPLLPNLAAHARSLLSSARIVANDLAARSSSITPTSPTASLSQLGPLAARSILLARDDSGSSNGDQNKVDPSKGVVRPQDINNTFLFVLFGLIGAAFVCLGIWFFFWAKNGGFHFRQNDWEDYKSTVLRRKGPNGTLLSGATPSTQLGGGSVYKDVDDAATEYTGGLTQVTGDTASTLTGITAGASDIAAREQRRQKRERKEREREKKKDRRNREKQQQQHHRRVGEDGALVDEEAEAEAKDHLRAYRHEKAARVGGINKAAEGSTWDGSTNPDNSTSAGSDLLSNRQSTPTNTPTKNKDRDRDENAKSGGRAGGIRKVYSTADRTADRESERLRAEARRLQEKGRAAGSSSSSGGGGVRRDFSFQRAKASHPPSTVVSSSVQDSTIEEEPASPAAENSHNNRYLPPPGGWAESEAAESDLGTKAYRHVIPGLSSSTVSGSAAGSAVGSDYAEEKRKKRGAGRYRKGDH